MAQPCQAPISTAIPDQWVVNYQTRRVKPGKSISMTRRIKPGENALISNSWNVHTMVFNSQPSLFNN